MKRKKLIQKYNEALIMKDQKTALKLWKKLLRKSLNQKKTHTVW